MKKITDFIVDHRNMILILFIILSGLSLYLGTKVNINSDISKYLPKTSETRKGMDIMEDNFDEIKSSTLNIMFEDLSNEEKEEMFEELEHIDGVDSVTWDESDKYNKDKFTMYVINVADVSDSKTANDVYEELSEKYKDAYLGGSIVESNKEVLNIGIIILAIVAAMIILIIMCESYIEPFLFLFTIGLGVFLNNGTNIFFSSVSNITYSISAILQMALSMDYSIMLMNRYSQEREHEKNKVKAMKNALYHAFQSISSSSVTTIVGLLALIFMSFTIGRDLGVVLAKGVLFSLICIFTCLPGLIILFDDLIRKTKKKNLNIKLDFLGKFSYKMRYVMPVIFIIIFIGSMFFKGNLNILYTGSEMDKIKEVFKENNQMALVYNNSYEDEISKLCKDLENNDNIDSVLCYSNTINDSLKYDELNKKLTDLGVDTEIDEDLLKIIYYNYYNRDDDSKYSLNDLVDLIDNDLRNNKTFKNKVDDELFDNIDTLKYFSTSKSINEKRNSKELSKILGIKSADIDKLLIYYNSKNINTKMTLSTFVNFLNNDVLKDKTYSKLLSNSAKNTLNMLTPFVNKDVINKEMTSEELSKLFGIGKEQIESLMLLYYLNIETSSKYTINEFILATDNINRNTNYLNGIDVSKITKLAGLSSNEGNINNTKLPKNNLQLFFKDIAPTLVDTVYISLGLPDTYTFTPNELLDLVLNNMSGSLEENTLENLKLLSLIMHNDSTKYTSNELSIILNIDKNSLINIYTLIDYTNGTRYKLSSVKLVDVILSNATNPSISSVIDSNTLSTLKTLKQVMNSVNNNTKYDASSLSKFLGLKRQDVELLYSLRYFKNNNINISLNTFIKFIVDDVLKNSTYSSMIDEYNTSKLINVEELMNNTLNGKKYSSKEFYNSLSKLDDGIDKSMIELLYIYNGSIKKYNKEWLLTVEEIIKYLNDDVINDKRFKDFIDKDMRSEIVDANDMIKESKDLLRSDEYSRMIINTTYNLEGDSTFEFIENLKNRLDNSDKDLYLVGDSPMAYDIKGSFNDEMNLITIITMISIFIVVAITFKSLIIPLILVLIIQCAVFFTMGIISLLGGSVYFIALLVVQSILMGATIDYAIVFTSYYKEYREKYDVKKSLIEAYNHSIHTIITSGAVLIIVTLIVGNFASAIAAKVCRTISEGTMCSVVLILLVLPALLAAFDKYICKNKS